MRRFETFLLLFDVICVVWFFLPCIRNRRWEFGLGVTGLTLLFAHCATEGYRWSMVPAYGLTVVLVAFAAVGPAREDLLSRGLKVRWARRLVTIASVGLAATLLVASLLLSLLFPVFVLLAPSGPYAVGTVEWYLVDNARGEPFTRDTLDRRELIVQAWYPARPERGARLAPDETSRVRPRLLATMLRLPPFVFDQIRLVKSHAYQGVPIDGSDISFPLVFYSHGLCLGHQRTQTPLMEELASHGYVVLGLTHPYESLTVEYPDGRIVPFDLERFREIARLADPAGREWIEAPTDSAKGAIMRKLIRSVPPADEDVRLWAEDTQSVLNAIERHKCGYDSMPFAGRLDLHRIGVAGVSFGGATAGQLVVTDNRFMAGVNLDGTQFGDMIDRPLERPFMFMTSRDTKGYFDIFLHEAGSDVYEVRIPSARHANYAGIAMLSPLLRTLGITGSIEGERMDRITNDYVLAFFDEYLRGKRSPLLEGTSSPYAEVTLLRNRR